MTSLYMNILSLLRIMSYKMSFGNFIYDLSFLTLTTFVMNKNNKLLTLSQ